MIGKLTLDSSKRLKTPLKLATAIAVSSGLGLALYLLHKKLSRPKTEEDDLREILKQKFKDEAQSKSYSDDLMKLVYKAAEPTAQEAYNKFFTKSTSDRMEALDDIPAYEELINNFETGLDSVLTNSLLKIVENAGGAPQRFKKVQRENVSDFTEIRKAFDQLFEVLKAKGPRRVYRKELTKDDVKEICYYQLSLLKQIASEEVKFKDLLLYTFWIDDKLYHKFQVESTSKVFLNGVLKCVHMEKDKEMVGCRKEIMGIMNKLQNSLFL